MFKIPFRVVLAATLAIWLTITAFVIFNSQPITDNVVSFTQIIFYLASLFMIGKAYAGFGSSARYSFFFLRVAIFGALITDIINYCVIFILHHPNFFISDISLSSASRVDRMLHIADYVEMFLWYIIILMFLINLVKSFYAAQSRYKIQFYIFSAFLGSALISLLYLSQPVQLKNSDFFAITAFASSLIEIATFIVAIYGIIHSKSLSLYLLLTGMVLMVFTQISALFYYSYPAQLFLKLAYISGPLWVMLIFLAFYHVVNKQDYDLKKWFVVPNTLESHLAFSALVITNASFISFFTLAYFLNLINQKHLLSFFLFIVCYSLVSVLVAKRIALFFTKPFQLLQINIGKLISEQAVPDSPLNFNLEEFNFLQSFIYSCFEKYEKKVKKIQAMAELSAQVAHDIRSPLAAINTVVSGSAEIPENRRIILRSASRRINDIANNLLLQTKGEYIIDNEENFNHVLTAELIFEVLDSVVSEKNYEYYKMKPQIQLVVLINCYNCFSNINVASFKRVLSNLINNGIEASGDNAFVVVRLASEANYVKISIEDTGCGIPPDILPKILKQGYTFNKKDGTGLGLSYAKEYIERLNGEISIRSKVNAGTIVTIKLPRSNIPDWFCEALIIKHGQAIVVLDDDISIHDAWNERLNGFSDVRLIHFYNVSDFIKNEGNERGLILYLIDYELLADEKNGLDVIEELGLYKNAILVTSCFDDLTVRARCKKLGIRIIPKSYVPYIQITCSFKNIQGSEIVYIDDDELMRSTWKFAAEASGVTVSTYASIAGFMKEIKNYKKNTLIYIDSELGENTKGEVYAKTLFDLGFTEIHLATGHDKKQFLSMPWIKSVIGKEPPWLYKFC